MAASKAEWRVFSAAEFYAGGVLLLQARVRE